MTKMVGHEVFSPELRSLEPAKRWQRRAPALALWLAATTFAAPATSATLTVPFDFTKTAIGLDVTVDGIPLYVILDTGVDPSVIDLARAETLGLTIDRGDGGEASGFGEDEGAAVYGATITGLAIHGRRFKPFEALASDLSALSKHYGRKLDGVIGYNFLSDKTVLIDYPRRALSIFTDAGEAKSLVRTCRAQWTARLTTTPDNFPIIPNFRVGDASGPVSLDTGSNGGIGLFSRALDLQGVRAAMVEKGTVVHSGARGDTRASTYTLTVPVG